MIELFRDDFSDFAVGPLPTDFTAAGEYHHMPHDDAMGEWYEPMRSNTWRPHAPWVVIEDDGTHRLLQTVEEVGTHPRVLTRGDEKWRNYRVSVILTPLKINGPVGLMVRYRSSLHNIRILIDEGSTIKLTSVHRHTEDTIAEAGFAYDTTTTVHLQVDLQDDQVTIYANGTRCIDTTVPGFSRGKIGLMAKTTAIFHSVEVTADPESIDVHMSQMQQIENDLYEARESQPDPVLWKRIDTRGFGTGRQVRFGHLKGDPELQIVLAQNLKLQSGNDSLTTIRCLTAVDLDGSILWQFGEPGTELDHGLVTCDLPFQIYDIDGDGYDEVLCLKNFKLYVLDGRTGKPKMVRPLPLNPEQENQFGRLTGDAIIIANFRGLDRPRDIIVKNRYRQFWAFSDTFDLLWTRSFPTWLSGHFAQPYDFDGDGKDELFVGYSLLDSDGCVLWSHEWTDHTDEIAIGPFDPDRKEVQIALVSGDEGFNIFSADGTVLHRDMVGHAQRLTAAKFRSDLPGLQFYVVTYWGHAGIISLHGCDGVEQLFFEPEDLGSILNPVNWSGDGTELALLSGCTRTGGMVDGYGRRVVVFPDDGHPDMCAEAIDLYGDQRDEVVLWDMNGIWIYTQDGSFQGESIYSPKRYPHYNASNYRAEISLPAWETPRGSSKAVSE